MEKVKWQILTVCHKVNLHVWNVPWWVMSEATCFKEQGQGREISSGSPVCAFTPETSSTLGLIWLSDSLSVSPHPHLTFMSQTANCTLSPGTWPRFVTWFWHPCFHFYPLSQTGIPIHDMIWDRTTMSVSAHHSWMWILSCLWSRFENDSWGRDKSCLCKPWWTMQTNPKSHLLRP